MIMPKLQMKVPKLKKVRFFPPPLFKNLLYGEARAPKPPLLMADALFATNFPVCCLLEVASPTRDYRTLAGLACKDPRVISLPGGKEPLQDISTPSPGQGSLLPLLSFHRIPWIHFPVPRAFVWNAISSKSHHSFTAGEV